MLIIYSYDMYTLSGEIKVCLSFGTKIDETGTQRGVTSYAVASSLDLWWADASQKRLPVHGVNPHVPHGLESHFGQPGMSGSTAQPDLWIIERLKLGLVVGHDDNVKGTDGREWCRLAESLSEQFVRTLRYVNVANRLLVDKIGKVNVSRVYYLII